MSEITTDPVEEKKGTFILFSTKDKLTRTELKTAFRVKKGRLISTKGNNWQIGSLFDRLIAIKIHYRMKVSISTSTRIRK